MTMAPMTNPRTPFAQTEPAVDFGRQAAMERPREPRRRERQVMGWVGIILLLVMTLIVALSEDFGASLAGCCGVSSYFPETYGGGPRWP